MTTGKQYRSILKLEAHRPESVRLCRFSVDCSTEDFWQFKCEQAGVLFGKPYKVTLISYIGTAWLATKLEQAIKSQTGIYVKCVAVPKD